MLVDDYYYVDDKSIAERNPKWLQDDYIKFIRFGQYLMAQTGIGLLSYITNHGYIDNPTFRGMRQNMLRQFTVIDILDLHGNTIKKERCPDGREDVNVFDIKQGVAIFAARKLGKKVNITEVHHSDLFGARQYKYDELLATSFANRALEIVSPLSPFYLFTPQDLDLSNEYDNYLRMSSVMPVNVMGFQTHRDNIVIDFERTTLEERIREFRAKNIDDSEIKTFFNLNDSIDWIRDTREKLLGDTQWKRYFTSCTYRLFDVRSCYYNPAVIDRPRRELVDNVVGKDNLCIGLGRQGVAVQDPVWSLAWVSRYPVDANIFRRGGINIFPLYLYPQIGRLLIQNKTRLNFSESFLKLISKRLGLQRDSENFPKDISPEEMVYYIYAVFYSLEYRERYAEFLKIDFPRLPLTSSLELFHALSQLGGELVSLHLMESSKLNTPITEWHGPTPSNEVEKVTYSDQTVWIDKGQTEGFQGVPENAWNFHIGGYQVCEKWLKDRKGRVLSAEDMTHYQRIVVALNETIHLMQEIDEVIEEHGGWPGAFLGGE